MDSDTEHNVGQLLDTPNLADALENDRFKQFLDHIPVAIAVAELHPAEHIVYVNLEFERLTGRTADQVAGQPWSVVPGESTEPSEDRPLSEVVEEEQDYLGVFHMDHEGQALSVDVWSNIIRDDAGKPIFRMMALADAGRSEDEETELKKRLAERDMRLRELQHRVRNNLQMITALVRLEARNIAAHTEGARFERLAGRIEALCLLYERLEAPGGESVDLAVYLAQIAAAVMAAHAHEGVRLELSLDSWEVVLDVAMPTGLVLNELMTNCLKHAFTDGQPGVIRVAAVTDETGCTITVADDGPGLPEGVVWPQRGKLGALIVHALRENAGAQLTVKSSPGAGLKVTIRFEKAWVQP